MHSTATDWCENGAICRLLSPTIIEEAGRVAKNGIHNFKLKIG